MPTIMVITISIMTIHQTTEVKPTPTLETLSHHIYRYTHTHTHTHTNNNVKHD